MEEMVGEMGQPKFIGPSLISCTLGGTLFLPQSCDRGNVKSDTTASLRYSPWKPRQAPGG